MSGFKGIYNIMFVQSKSHYVHGMSTHVTTLMANLNFQCHYDPS